MPPATDPPLGQEVGENVQWSMKAWSGKPRRGDFPMRLTQQGNIANIGPIDARNNKDWPARENGLACLPVSLSVNGINSVL